MKLLFFILQIWFVFSCAPMQMGENLAMASKQSYAESLSLHYHDIDGLPDFITKTAHGQVSSSTRALKQAKGPRQELVVKVQYNIQKQKQKEKQKQINLKQTNLVYKPFPVDYNEHVGRWIQYYSKGEGHLTMKKHLERSTRYMPIMKTVLEQKDLPLDLVYMVMIESGFSHAAHSHAHAVGFWQFIHATGSSYGLKINHIIDDRRDFILSTQAASHFLTDLYSQFGDWRLSMAAYNAGPSRIFKAIKKHESKDFWYLTKKKALPKETSNYVPKIIAARTIAKQPEKYNFTNLTYQKPLQYRLLIITKSVLISDISTHLDVPVKTLQQLNPKFKTNSIHVNHQHIYFRVPL